MSGRGLREYAPGAVEMWKSLSTSHVYKYSGQGFGQIRYKPLLWKSRTEIIDLLVWHCYDV